MMTAAVCAVLAAALAGSGPADPIFSRWETLGTRDGLPSAKVMAIAVDGTRVWAGTEKGLAVMDRASGGAFTPIAGLPFPVVTALAVDASTGDLWIGTMGGLARLSAGRVDSFTQLDSGLANNVVYGVAIDGAGVWVATAAGLNRYDTLSNTWEIFDTSNTLMQEPWCYAVTGAGGSVYVAVWGGGVLVRDPQGRFREHRDPDGEMEIDLFRDDGLVHDVTSAVALSRDVLWVGTYFGLSRYDGRHWRSFSEEDSGLAGNFINALAASRGVVWVATDQGLSRFDDTTWHTWQRTGDTGVRLRISGPGDAHRVLQLRRGPASNTIYGIALEGDAIWLATASGVSHGVAGDGAPKAPARSHPPANPTTGERK